MGGNVDYCGVVNEGKGCFLRVRVAAIRVLSGIAAALLITGAAYRLHFNLSAATSIHLLLITVIALRWGFSPASAVSVVSVGCLDYFFTEPLFHFYMSDSHDWVALATFESVALVVSRVSDQVHRHATDSELHRSHLQRLYQLSQDILLLNFQESIEPQLAVLIQRALSAKGVALWNAYDLHLSKAGMCEFEEAEVRSVFYTESNEDNGTTRVSRRVLRSGTRSIGALLIQGHAADSASVNAAGSLVAIAIERARSFAAESSAEAARQSEQLRAAVLDALAHAFKTPLTAIQTSSSGLLEMNTLASTEKRLVTLIDQQATHLAEITTRLLRTAKFDNASLRLKQKPVDVAELVRESLAESKGQFVLPAVDITPTSDPVVAFADRHLLKMALIQLLDNAAKYGKAEAPILIDVREEQNQATVSVHNEGSFIPLEERSRIFERFYRSPGSAHKASGTGIGLSVVKHVVEAHHGQVWVTSDAEEGTTFFLTIPTGKR
jgi:two-component system, OmpR family, sensor histidine kinase KdpD